MTHTSTEQPEALRLARKFEEVGFIGDHRFAKDHWCRQSATELRRQHARIAELEAQLAAIGAGGVEPLRKQVAAPQAVQAAVPVGGQSRFKGEKDWQWCSAEHVAMVLLATPSEWQNYEVRYVYAHPAEGVPVQVVELEVDDLIDRLLNAQQDLNLAANVHMDQSIASASTLLDEVEIALRTLAATHPTQQGLDARDAAFEAVRKAFCNLQRYSFWLDSRGNVRRCADRSGNWVEFEAAHTLFEPQSVDAALAAQAKRVGTP